MFVRASTVILAIAAGLLAVPGVAAGLMPASQCDTSNLKCCDSVMNAASAATLPSLLGLVLDPTALVGLNCVTIPVVGTGTGANCVQQPVCCTDVQQNGLVNTGCTPVNINL